MIYCTQTQCQNFTFTHSSTHIHDFRERICKYNPCLLIHDLNHTKEFIHPKVPCQNTNCNDFTFSHCSQYTHTLRIKICNYHPCLLLHDVNHAQNYSHTIQYQNLSIKNFEQNKTHPIFIKDIWFNIHKFLDNTTKIYACNCSIYQNRLRTVNALLQTSKIFSTLLDTNLKSVDFWIYNSGKYEYCFEEVDYSWKHTCYCSYDCINCKNIQRYGGKYDDSYDDSYEYSY
jgi:hypothetical protein